MPTPEDDEQLTVIIVVWKDPFPKDTIMKFGLSFMEVSEAPCTFGRRSAIAKIVKFLMGGLAVEIARMTKQSSIACYIIVSERVVILIPLRGLPSVIRIQRALRLCVKRVRFSFTTLIRSFWKRRRLIWTNIHTVTILLTVDQDRSA